MDYLSVIKHPIESDFQEFVYRFQSSLSHSYGLLSQALEHIRQRTGKQMRPMLTLLSAKNYGEVSDITQHAAVALELLHTASLIHDLSMLPIIIRWLCSWATISSPPASVMSPRPRITEFYNMSPTLV